MPVAFLGSALIQFALGLVAAWILGPAEFGAYAVALSAAVLVQTISFEWLRLAATRFHHGGDGGRLARRLGRVLALFALGMLGLAVLAFFLGGGRRWVFCLVPLIAAASGFADFRAALLRAEFDQHRYSLFIVLRNIFAIIALPAAAYRFGTAEAALAAFLLAIVLASGWIELLRRANPGDDQESPERDKAPDLAALLRYSGPIVVTNGLYLGLFFGIRSIVALTGGFAAAGQVSLALDFTLKLFTTIGAALDLLLFQLAVRESRTLGAEAGLARLKANSELVLVAVLPIAIGLFLVVGGLEGFLVAPEFRGMFSMLVSLLLPGIALYVIVQYVLHPYLQLAQRTPQLIFAALAALIAAAILFPVLRGGGIMLFPAIGGALAGSMLTACVVLGFVIGSGVLPAARFIAKVSLALGAMAGAVLLVRGSGGGIVPLVLSVFVGVAVYVGVAYALDLTGIRSSAFGRKRQGQSPAGIR